MHKYFKYKKKRFSFFIFLSYPFARHVTSLNITNSIKFRKRHMGSYPRTISTQSKENNFYPVTSIEDFSRLAHAENSLSQPWKVSSIITATKIERTTWPRNVPGSRSSNRHFSTLEQTRAATPDTMLSLHFAGKWRCRGRGTSNAMRNRPVRIVGNIIIRRQLLGLR